LNFILLNEDFHEQFQPLSWYSHEKTAR